MSLDHLYELCDPVRRQLLGSAPSGANGFFDPSDADVPLRAWIAEHLGAHAVAP
jgi:ectoine hydroxylase